MSNIVLISFGITICPFSPTLQIPTNLFLLVLFVLVELELDLSFAVFFKPRIAEEIKRYNATVSYTKRRGVCQKAAKQLGKHWSEVTYDDLSKVDLPADQMLALKAVLGAHIPVDMSECEIFLYNDHPESNIEKYRTDKYDTIEEMLIQEMIENESQLSDKHIKKLSLHLITGLMF